MTALEMTLAYYNELSGQVKDALTDAVDTQKYDKTASYAKIKEIKDAAKKALPGR